MYTIENKYSKTVKSLLTDAEVVREQKYLVPQFGASNATADENGALEAFQEALAYFVTPAAFVAHMNWSMTVAAQRRSNNDLRSVTQSSDPATNARVQLVLTLAKRTAEAECGETGADGAIKVDRKSDEYVAALRDSIRASIAKPKFADLAVIFEAATASAEIPVIDLTIPGALNKAEAETAETA